MRRALNHFSANRSGATAIEYSLIIAFIALAIVAALPQIGQALAATFQTIADVF